MWDRVAALRAFVYETVLAVALVLGLLVLALEVAPRAPLLAEGVQRIGLALALAGGALWLWATVVLVARGEGTPLPLDPPRRLVTSGPYRFLRNPMLVGLITFFLGEALLFRSPVLLAIVALGAAGLVAYVRWREEPGLAARFAGYAAYRAGVPAWLPRFTGVGGAWLRLRDRLRSRAARDSVDRPRRPRGGSGSGPR